MTFAIITPALIVGGFAERMKFSAVLPFSAFWLIIVYAPITHWVWGGGWLWCFSKPLAWTDNHCCYQSTNTCGDMYNRAASKI
jgi:ammonia channel protein AmtB